MKAQIAHDKIKPLLNKNEFIVFSTLRKTGRLCQKDLIKAINKKHYMDQPMVSGTLKNLIKSGVVVSESDGMFEYIQVNSSRVKQINRICSELAAGYDASVTALDLIETV